MGGAPAPAPALALWTVAVLAALLAAAATAPTAPRCSAAAARAGCRNVSHVLDTGLYEFTVQGKYFSIEYVDGKNISFRCGAGGMSLESDALPAFGAEVRAERVAVEGCPPAPYAAALRALNVTLAPLFDLSLANTAGAGQLEPGHLDGLRGARSLRLRAAGAPRGPLLARLPALAELTVLATRLPAGELDVPPPLLEHVTLTGAGVTRVPAALLALPRLRSLAVEEAGGAVHVERPPVGAGGGALRSLYLSEAEEELLGEWAPPALEAAFLGKWAAVAPGPLPACAALATLRLVAPATQRLPPGWTGRCGRLATLELHFARQLTSLPPGLLANASSLTRLVLRSGALLALPPDMFEETPHLAHLDLSGNHLMELPSGMLMHISSSLLELNLSANELTSAVGGALASLRHLRRLSLADNRRLRDLCQPPPTVSVTVNKNKSTLASLSQLEVLNLRNTDVTVICSDWRRELRRLAELDLSGTALETLTYDDLKYTRDVPSVVRLLNTSLHDVLFAEVDYDEARAAAARPGASNVTVVLGSRGGSGSLACDCYLYWFARMVEDGLLPVEGAGGLRCAGGGLLRDARADGLLCPAPPGACPAPLPRGCSCGVAGGLRAPRVVLRVRCAGVGLTRVPRLPRAGAAANVGAVDLLLPDNAIVALVPEDIPPLLRTLDLRNNSIERIEDTTAAALVGGAGGGARRVRLAGNPLECSCGVARARRVLAAARCGGGRALADVTEAECAAPPVLGAALAGLAAAAALGAVALGARRAGALRRLKAALRRLRPLEASSSPRPYDVFVTFGRGDEAAALAVAARLEAGAGARRVLLQERDWLPPAWLPHAVAASVRAARCTVALLSPAWERWLEHAEVRAAYEEAWRGALVLVLPPASAPAPAPADPALARYVRDHPHLVLRRGDRDFWRGLERALPPPPPPPPPRLPTVHTSPVV